MSDLSLNNNEENLNHDITTGANTERSQELIQHSKEKTPEEFIDLILNIACQIDEFKKDLKTEHNFLTNKIFNLLGYRYSSIIANSNFFHYATQAIIVDIFRQLILKPQQNKNFKTVLEFVKTAVIKEESYIETIEILLGSEILPIDKNNGLIFLAKINSSRRKTLASIPEEISQKTFEENIMTIFREAVNNTLNESEKNNKNYLTKFEQLTQDKCLSAFAESVGDANLIESSQTFFNFANCSFLELIKDLHEFNKYSHSLFYQIKFVLLKNVRTFSDLLIRLVQFGHFHFIHVLETLHLSKIAELYKAFVDYSLKSGKYSLNKIQDLKVWLDDTYVNESHKVTKCYNEITEFSKNKYTDLKKWIDNSALKMPLSLPFLFSETVIQYSHNTQLFLFDKVYSPIKGVTVTYGGSAINFMIKSTGKVKENAISLYNNFRTKVDSLYDDVKETLLEGKDSYFKIKNEEQYFIISINKKLLYFPGKFFELISYMVETVQQLDIKETAMSAYTTTKGKVTDLSNYLVNKYKSFLGEELKDEEEIIHECNDCDTDKKIN